MNPTASAQQTRSTDKFAPLRPRLGFVGLGWIGTHRLVAIVRAGVADVIAIADPDEQSLIGAVPHVPGACCFTNPAQLVDLNLDGIVIATPSAQHAEQSIAALKRNLAVFCQKPLGRNTSEVSGVIGAARSADRLLGVDLSYRYTEALQKIRQLVRQNELGEIFGVDLVFHNAYGPQKPWFYDRKKSGGG